MVDSTHFSVVDVVSYLEVTTYSIQLTHACHPTQVCIPTCILVPARQACIGVRTFRQSVQGYMHTHTSMSTSENSSHSRKLINSFIVVCTVVSLSNCLHIITVALSVSSPCLPSVVWYRETDLQCLLIFPWLGTAQSTQTVVIVFLCNTPQH
jgi:hypothetical protein